MGNLNKRNIIFYRPQRSWGKVMFFTGVCDSVHRGDLPQCMLGYHPPRSSPPEQAAPPQEQTPPRAGTPPEKAPPQEQTPPRADTPPEQAPSRAEHAGRYGQCAGGTHPTGMQSCLTKISLCTKQCFSQGLMNIIFFSNIDTVSEKDGQLSEDY